MKPGGIIPTKMIWNKPKYWPFNVILLAWQLTFLIVGTMYGKTGIIDKLLPSIVMWTARSWSVVLVISGIYYGITLHWLYPIWHFILLISMWLIPFAFNGLLKPIWRAATICHVRLHIKSPEHEAYAVFISFTAPEVKIEKWSYALLRDLRNTRFSYLDPTFEVSEAEEKAMNAYAEKIKGDPVARKYDYLQLLSYAVNLVCWIVYPPCWGREVIGWFNLPGGREVCSSGVIAELRESIVLPRVRQLKPPLLFLMMSYDTSIVSPCLFDIDKNWKRKKEKL